MGTNQPNPGLSRESYDRINTKINTHFKNLQTKLEQSENYSSASEQIRAEQRGLMFAEKILLEEFEGRG